MNAPRDLPRTGERARAGPLRVLLCDIEPAMATLLAEWRELDRTWPGVPVIVLAPTLLPSVSPQGEVARQLGAAAVLPAPVSREVLRAAVASLLAG